MLKHLVCLSVAALAVSMTATAQVPKTPSGKPDLNGVWTNASLTPLSRPSGRPLVVDAETATQLVRNPVVAGRKKLDEDYETRIDPSKLNTAPEKGSRNFGNEGYDFLWVTPGERLAIVNGEYRTSYIIDPPDGQLPFTAEYTERRRAMMARRPANQMPGEGPFDGPEDAAQSERCLVGFSGPAGPGMLNPIYNNNYQFVLTDDHLMVLVEMAHDVRIIPIFQDKQTALANHKPAAIKPWFGDSVAWWEGDTLVTDVANLNPGHTQTGFPLSTTGRVTERLTRTGEQDIHYQFTVNDPATYKQPWTAELTFYPQSRVYEYACHEGNYGIVGMLAGAREKERQLAATAKPKAVRGGE